MATLTITNLEESTKDKLRLQAARHGRSMAEEARMIKPDLRSGKAWRRITASDLPDHADSGLGSG